MRWRRRRNRWKVTNPPPPDPPTTSIPVDPAILAIRAIDPRPPMVRPHRCGCGRLTAGAFCCEPCEVATRGGWPLARWQPGMPWWLRHDRECDAKQIARDPVAAEADAKWNAGSMRAPGRRGP